MLRDRPPCGPASGSDDVFALPNRILPGFMRGRGRFVDQGDQSKAKAGTVRRQRLGEVAVLTLDHPPANAVTLGLIEALGAALEIERSDPAVAAILILGAGTGFSAGMDPSVFGTIEGAAALGRLARRIETCPKPVTAALHGTAFGAGLELALACHWRIAAADAQMGLPEIHLGLVPGSGGSQRLPRLVGGRAALRLMLEGAPIGAAEALALGLVDQVVETAIFDAAVNFALTRPGPRPTAEMFGRTGDLFGPGGALAETRAALAGHRLPAPPRLVDCVEAAALLPFEQGLALEAATFADLAASDEAKGLRAAWMAERRAAQVPAAVARLGPVRVERLGLWAPPDSATETILRALGAGLEVRVGAADRAALVAVLNAVAARQDAMLAEGRLTEMARDADWARLIPVMEPGGMAGVDLILAAADAPERLPAELRVLPGGLPPGAAGLALSLPDGPGGPAELAMGAGADPALAARALALARRLGARAVFTGPGGPVLARLRRALGLAIAALERAGVERRAVTAALAAYGMGTGTRSHLPAMPEGGEAILRACLAALAAEGGRMVEAGTARRPLDVDAIAIHAGLIPRWEGGPMAWADRLGLLVLRADLWKRAEGQPALYATPPLFDRLIAAGQTLSSLNGRKPT
jgi:3-hydroxyacyl-CoA dehydrogenase